MTKSRSQGPPGWLLWFGAAAAVVAIIYAVLSTDQQPPPASTAPSGQMPGTASVPVTDSPPPSATFAQLVGTGNLRMDAGLFSNAIKYYSAALALDSAAVPVWVDRGACRHALGDGEGARADFNRALQLEPTHTIAHLNMGITYFTEGQADSARNWCNRLLLISTDGLHADRARQILAQLDSLQR